MNKVVVAFLLCLASPIVNAQAFEARKPILCDNAQVMIKSLTEQYNEKPVWTAKNPQDDTRFSLFLNEKAGTWTLLQMTPEVACILGVGEDSKFYLGKPV